MAHYPTACLSTSAAAVPLLHHERERLLASVDKWVCRLVNRAGIPAAEVEDVIQDCRLEVWKASERFDPARGIAFTTFAGHVVRRRLSEFKRDGCTRKGPPTVAMDRPDQIGADPAGDDDQLAEAEDREGADLRAAINELAAGEWVVLLTESQQRLFRLIGVEGLTLPQAADRLGVKLSICEIALRGIVKKLVASGKVGPELEGRLAKWRAEDAVAPARKTKYRPGREWRPAAERKPTAAEKPAGAEKPAAKGE